MPSDCIKRLSVPPVMLDRPLSPVHSVMYPRALRCGLLLCRLRAHLWPAGASVTECWLHWTAGPPSTDVMLARALLDYDELDGLNVPVPGGYQVPVFCTRSPVLQRRRPCVITDLWRMPSC